MSAAGNYLDRNPAGTKRAFSHEALMDAMMLNPRIDNKELAQIFGYSAAWIGTIVNSDAFRVALHRRKSEIIDPTLVATLEDHYRNMAIRSVQVITQKLNAPAEAVSDDLALRAAALGATMFKQTAPAPAAVPESSIDKLADRLIALQQGFRGTTLVEPQVIDVTPA